MPVATKRHVTDSPPSTRSAHAKNGTSRILAMVTRFAEFHGEGTVLTTSPA